MFGTQWLGTLAGLALLSHQIGGFLGVWLGGVLFDRFGSYDPVWWLSILLGVFSALVNMPIVEKPVSRGAALPAQRGDGGYPSIRAAGALTEFCRFCPSLEGDRGVDHVTDQEYLRLQLSIVCLLLFPVGMAALAQHPEWFA